MKINATITSTPMQLKEGVLANNDILDFNEFKSFMEEKINSELLNSLYVRLNQIEGCIKQQKYKEAYLRWERLEQAILFNNEYAVSLLFIDNINTPNASYNFQYASKEYDVLGNRGKLTRIRQLSEQLYKEHVAEQVEEHLSEFLDDVATKNTRWKFIEKIFSGNDSEIKRNAANARWHTHDWTYKNILYGDNPVWQGNVADAFMNHMAHLHVQIMAANLNSAEDEQLFATSVFNEEKDNIWNLLIASKNNTPWYTGGDIIFKYQGQIYNIQLKTGLSTGKSRRSRIGGKLATTDLLNFIQKLKSDIKSQDINLIIQSLYNELKTSGYVEVTNKILNQSVDDLFKT